MRIERRFTNDPTGAYGGLGVRITASEIRNPDGSLVFRNEAVEVPESWSQVASDVIAQKYFRRAGVPARLVNCPTGTEPARTMDHTLADVVYDFVI